MTDACLCEKKESAIRHVSVAVTLLTFLHACPPVEAAKSQRASAPCGDWR
jgi:hypothetical protein